MVLNVTIGKLLLTGIGIWGNNIPVGWAFDIINFVWWIGIGHAGTLISAILLLFRQQWRTSINRFAEAMTLFAVACAAMFPLLHTGRPWLAIYWLFPYPNTMGAVAAVPQPADVGRVRGVDLRHGVGAVLVHRSRARHGDAARSREVARPRRCIYGMLSLGWRGSARHWQRYEMAYLLLAGISTPLVLSVHSVVSFDFAVSVLPGWHATIFPPYFVAGAIYSGFAMVMTLAIPLRKFYRPRRLHHHASHPQHDEGHAGDRDDRGVWLRERGVLRVVQRQPVRSVHDVQPHDRDRMRCSTGRSSRSTR